jgi:hypothetical protein
VAAPLKQPSAKQKANLKKGGQKPPSAAKKLKVDEARKISRRLLADPVYRKRLIKRLREGTIQPGVEAMLYYYAYGKPRESVEVEQKSDVKIVHQYRDE